MPRSMRRIVPNQRDEGFTLVELVVAMLIIGIVLVSVATVQVGTLQTNADNAARNTASALANGAMEQFRSLPWNVLRKGMASNYLTASGGDSLVVSGMLLIPGNATSHTVKVAPSGASDQDLTGTPWLPLFDNTGSHTQVVDDPEGNGNQYRVKAYVTDPDGGVSGAVGLAVVVEWQRPGSTVVHYTSVFSTAYAPVGGCGSLDKAPFLTSCQPQYRSSSNSASLTVLVSSNEYDVPTAEVGDARPLVSGSTAGGINSAGSRARASSDSAQSTVVSATVEHAVSSVTPLNAGDTATVVGGTPSLVLQASDNTADPDAPPAHAGVTSGSGSSSATAVLGSGSVSVDADISRSGTVTASTTNSCSVSGASSVPAGQPCAVARLDRSPSAIEATGVVEGESIDFVTSGSTASEESKAWVGRFQLGGTTGSAGVTGCSALSGAGCVSAGAMSYAPTITVGQVPGTGWYNAEAPNGLVVVSSYSDSVLVERGAAQDSTPGAITRSATINYWNGSGYSTINVNSTTEGTWATPVVFLDGAAVTLSASATISVSAPSERESGSQCDIEMCRVQADAGLISVTLKIIVEPLSGSPYQLEALALINGSTADAQFTEPVDV